MSKKSRKETQKQTQEDCCPQTTQDCIGSQSWTSTLQVNKSVSHLKYGVYIVAQNEDGARTTHLVSAHSHFEDAQLTQGNTLAFSESDLQDLFNFAPHLIEGVIILPL